MLGEGSWTLKGVRTLVYYTLEACMRRISTPSPRLLWTTRSLGPGPGPDSHAIGAVGGRHAWGYSRITENRRLEMAAAAMKRRMMTRSSVRVLSDLPPLAITSRTSAIVVAGRDVGDASRF